MGNRTLSLLIGFFVAFCGLGLWLTRASAPEVTGEPAPEVAVPAAPTAPVALRPLQRRAPSPSAAVPRPSPAISTPPAALLRQLRRPSPIMDPHATPMAGGSAESEAKNAQPTSTSRLEEAELRGAIQSVEPLIHQCFVDAQDRFPPPQQVTLSFTLVGQGTSGHFEGGAIKASTLQDPWVQSCFLDALTDARFPIPEGGEGRWSITHPFTFPREDGGSAP